MSKRARAAVPLGLGILLLSEHYHAGWLGELLRAVGSMGLGWVVAWLAGVLWIRCRPAMEAAPPDAAEKTKEATPGVRTT